MKLWENMLNFCINCTSFSSLRIRYGGWTTKLHVTLFEGKNRQIRKLCSRSHLQVRLLHRMSMGTVSLGALPEGACRYLTIDEVHSLYTHCTPRQEIDDQIDLPYGTLLPVPTPLCTAPCVKSILVRSPIFFSFFFTPLFVLALC